MNSVRPPARWRRAEHGALVFGGHMNMRTAHDGVELSEPEIDTLRRLNLKPALGAEATLEAQVPQRLIDYGYVVQRDSGPARHYRQRQRSTPGSRADVSVARVSAWPQHGRSPVPASESRPNCRTACRQPCCAIVWSRPRWTSRRTRSAGHCGRKCRTMRMDFTVPNGEQR